MTYDESIELATKATIGIDKKVKRGSESINYIRFILTILIGLSYVIMNNMPIIWYYKIMIISVLILFWVYLCFRCIKFQNILFKIKDKLEDWI